MDVLFRDAPHLIVSYVESITNGYNPIEDAAIALTTLELLC